MVESVRRVSWRRLLDEATRTLRRYPASMACAAGFTVLLIGEIHDLWSLPEDVLGRWLGFLVLGLFAALAASLFAEHRGWRRPLVYAGEAAALAALALVVLTGEPEHGDIQAIRRVLLGGALVLLVTVAPFLGRRGIDDAFWEFNRAAWLGAAFGGIFALVLGAGASAVLMALETLFGLDIDGELYGDVWLIAFAFIWPWVALAAAPDALEAPPGGGPPWIRIMAGALLVPIASVYLALLYAYALLILVTWELPRGNVASVVCGFAAMGVVTHMIAHPWRAGGNRWLALYCRHFYALLVVPIALLAVAVAVRVGDYGVTEARYVLIVVAVWLALLSASFLLRRASLRLVPLSLAVLLLVGAHGPLSAVAVATRSQMAILEDALVGGGMFVDGRVVAAAEAIAEGDHRRLAGAIDYLLRTGKRDVLVEWLAQGGLDPETIESAYTDQILTIMGLEPLDDGVLFGLVPGEAGGEKYFRYESGRPWPLVVEGFAVVSVESLWGEMTREIVGPGGGNWRLTLDADGRLSVAEGEAAVHFDLAALVGELIAAGAPMSPAPGRLTLDRAGDGLRVRLILKSLSGSRGADGQVIDLSASTVLLLARD